MKSPFLSKSALAGLALIALGFIIDSAKLQYLLTFAGGVLLACDKFRSDYLSRRNKDKTTR